MPAGSDLAVAAARFGIALDAVTAGKLERELAAANADRKKYTMSIDEALQALGDARDNGIGIRHGGKGGAHAMTPSTVVLAVRVDERVIFAIGTAPARSPSPGVVWKELAPWQQALSKNLPKVLAWAQHEPTRLVAKVIEKAAVSLRQSAVTRDAVLAEVLRRPQDDEPRLVYADTLTARGDPRGEFIVIQCALAAGSTDPKLVKRETELRRKHGAAWMKDVKQHARVCEMRRGFVASMTMTAQNFMRAGDVFEREPIEELVILSPAANALGKLAPVPHLAHITKLGFDERVWLGNMGHVRELQKFLRALTNVRELHLRFAYWDQIDASGLFDDVEWPSLEVFRLELGRGNVVPASLDRVAMPRLRVRS